MPLSTPKAVSATDRAAIPAPIATAPSTTIQPTVIHWARRACCSDDCIDWTSTLTSPKLAGESCSRRPCRCRGQLVELSHRVRAADGDLLVQGRADDSAHLAPAHVLAIDAPDDSPRRVPELIDAGLDRETVEDPAIVELLPQQQDIGSHRLVVDPITRSSVDQSLQGLVVYDKHLDRHAGVLLERLLDPDRNLLSVRCAGREDDVA